MAEKPFWTFHLGSIGRQHGREATLEILLRQHRVVAWQRSHFGNSIDAAEVGSMAEKPFWKFY